MNILTLMGAVLVLAAALASTATAGDAVEEQYGGRTMLLHVPAQLPPRGTRALVVVLHGGLGNARRIEAMQSEHGLNMDAVADRSGFVVAYLNGTPVTRYLGADKLGWNAGGGCCGQSAERNEDDVGYIGRAIDRIVDEYGVDRSRVFGIGHSNGAMMAQRVICERGILAAVVAISGPLNLEGARCSAARGRRVFAIHGALDANVPVAGGRGTEGMSRVAYVAEASSRRAFLDAGASYELEIVPGADHNLDHIGAVISSTQGQSVAEKAARFFGLIAERQASGPALN